MTRKTKKSSTTRLTCLPCIFAAFLVLTVAAPGHAGLTPMENTELEAVTGNAGFSIAIKDVQIFHHIDTYRYCATDNGYIEFQNFYMHGIGDVAKFNFDFGTTMTDSGIIHYDVFETEIASLEDWNNTIDPAEIYRGMVSTIVPNWDQELAYTIGNLSFFDPNYPNTTDPAAVDLGSLTMGLIDIPHFSNYISPRIDGVGFDFQTSFQMTIDKIGYAFNDHCDALEFCPIYIGESFTGDPETPASWAMNGDFQIGDLFGDTSALSPADWKHSNPAKINVGEGEIYGADNGIYGTLAMNLPMQGSIRFESATFDGTDFGPGAIDGMQVHRLNLMLIP